MSVQEAITIFQIVGLLSVSLVIAILAFGAILACVSITREVLDDMKVLRARLPVRIEEAKRTARQKDETQ